MPVPVALRSHTRIHPSVYSFQPQHPAMLQITVALNCVFQPKEASFAKVTTCQESWGAVADCHYLPKSRNLSCCGEGVLLFPSEVTERKMEIKSGRERAVKKLKAVTRHWLLYG